MEKTTVSARLPTKLVKRIDELSSNRTNFITNAVIEQIYDEEIVEDEIKRRKRERDQFIDEKHRIERKIESQRDEIRKLENLLTETRSLKKTKEKIPEKEIHRVRQIIRKNKYDNDPRSLSPERVVDHNADNLADKYEVEKEKVEEILKIYSSA